jgi:hypothetical protein
MGFYLCLGFDFLPSLLLPSDSRCGFQCPSSLVLISVMALTQKHVLREPPVTFNASTFLERTVVEFYS